MEFIPKHVYRIFCIKYFSFQLINALEEHNWLDEKTRSFFIEFTVYNANVNLFGSVILLVEWMAAGSAVTRTEVKVDQECIIIIKQILRI